MSQPDGRLCNLWPGLSVLLRIPSGGREKNDGLLYFSEKLHFSATAGRYHGFTQAERSRLICPGERRETRMRIYHSNPRRSLHKGGDTLLLRSRRRCRH